MDDVEIAAKIFSERFRIPADVLMIYARLWQLETWLREMVYLELKAAQGNFNESMLNKSKSRLEGDKKLRHMATAYESPLAYTDFSKLWELVFDENQWSFFEPYFPPKRILESKVEELESIRNRVAHVREPHRDDLRRVEQFLRDIDQGFWRFCTSYNAQYPVPADEQNPLTATLTSNDRFSLKMDSTYFWRARSDKVSTLVQRSYRPWCKRPLPQPPVSVPGVLYHATFYIQGRNIIDYPQVLKSTKDLHPQCIHIGLDILRLSISIPSVLGPELIGKTVIEFLWIIFQTGQGADSKDPDDTTAAELAAQWPEYVLPPSNPLTFLAPDMPCSFFRI